MIEPFTVSIDFIFPLYLAEHHFKTEYEEVGRQKVALFTSFLIDMRTRLVQALCWSNIPIRFQNYFDIVSINPFFCKRSHHGIQLDSVDCVFVINEKEAQE